MFAKVAPENSALFVAMASVAEQRAGDFEAQALANTAWAFAKVEQSDATLFVALAKVATSSSAMFMSGSLRTLRGRIIAAYQRDEESLAATEKTATPRFGGCHARDFANITLACCLRR